MKVYIFRKGILQGIYSNRQIFEKSLKSVFLEQFFFLTRVKKKLFLDKKLQKIAKAI